MTLALNNFFSTHGINGDFWHFVSNSVPYNKVPTKIYLCRNFCYLITIFMSNLTGLLFIMIKLSDENKRRFALDILRT